MKKNKQDTKVSDIFTDDINNLTEHLNIVIEAHNKQLDEIERLNNIINELENKIWYLYNYASLDTSNLKKELQELKENK